MLGREQVGVAAAGVVEEKSEGCGALGPDFSVQALDYFQHGPDYEAEEDGVAGVAC